MRALLVLLVACIVGCCTSTPAPVPPPSHEELARELENKTVALVGVEIDEDAEIDPFCSGVWVSHNEILTAAHCTEQYEIGDVVLYSVARETSNETGKLTAAQSSVLVKRDEAHDLALLQVPDWPLPPIHDFATISRGELSPGQPVFTMGSPVDLTWSFSSGEIAAIRLWQNLEEVAPVLYVQATAPIGPGSSGGGLFDSTGRLVGIARGSFNRAENANLFVHRDVVAAFLGARS